MMSRRDVVLGLGCAGSVAVAEAVRPRARRTMLKNGTKLEDLVPRQFPHWRQGGSGSIILPAVQGDLSSRLYGEQLARIYEPSDRAGPAMMLLIAYGRTQTDTLQLHRPESCYPAVGLEIVHSSAVELPMPGSPPIPAMALTAASDRRVEDIVYWTRVGRDLPQTLGQQRMAVLASGLRGYVDDGTLVRASAVRWNGRPIFDEIALFLAGLVSALPPPGRLALLGNSGVHGMDHKQR